MGTADPATRAALAFEQLLGCSLDTTLTRVDALGGLYPADELITGERGNVLPECKNFFARQQRLFEIGWQLVYGTF